MYGTSEAFINALWRALPGWARTPHARNGQKLADLAAAWDNISVGDAFANSLGVALQTLTAGALYGTATDALTRAFGEGPGFGLYRAWATGEFAYSNGGSSYDPYRLNRGGGSIGEATPSPPIDRSWNSGNRYVSGDSFSYGRRRAQARAEARKRRSEWLKARREAFRRQYPETYRRMVEHRRKWRKLYKRGAEMRRRRVAWMVARGF